MELGGITPSSTGCVFHYVWKVPPGKKMWRTSWDSQSNPSCTIQPWVGRAEAYTVIADVNAGSCLFQVLRQSWLTKLFFKARDSHSELLRADLISEPSCSAPFLSWAVHREIHPYTNKQQNWVQQQLPFPFHIFPLKGVWLCQPSPSPCPSSTNTLTFAHEEQWLLNVLPSLLNYSLSWTARFSTGTLGTTLHMT